jgi:uncharacterized protein (TIGR00369 family)
MQPPVAENTPSAAYSDLHRQLAARVDSGLAAHLGIRLVEVRHGFLCAQLEIMPHHIAANGYLHAGSVVTLADSACGFGCFASLPEGAINFTTIELKSNFLRTMTAGILRAEARLIHGGRRTQVWDATVYDATHVESTIVEGAYNSSKARVLALFRCTQMLLYPQREGEGA